VVNIEEIIDDLSTEMRGVHLPMRHAKRSKRPFDENALFRAFKRAVGRRCSTWEPSSRPIHQNDQGQSLG
jgi:hypothetical protein